MILVDKKILGGGIAMVITGVVFLLYLNSTIPLWNPDMTDQQSQEIEKKQREHRDYINLAAMLAGIGFLLVLISFGARRKKGGSKTVEKKPPEQL